MFKLLYDILYFSKDLINLIYEYSNDTHRITEKIIINNSKIKEIEIENSIIYNKLSLYPFDNNNFDNFKNYVKEVINIKTIFNVDVEKIFFITDLFDKNDQSYKVKLYNELDDIYTGNVFLIIKIIDNNKNIPSDKIYDLCNKNGTIVFLYLKRNLEKYINQLKIILNKHISISYLRLFCKNNLINYFIIKTNYSK